MSRRPPAAARARVVVVDDTASIRTLVRLVLSTDDRFELVGEAADGLAAIELAAEVQPDVMVLDRDMPHLDGVAAIPRIREAAPRCAIVVFTAEADAGTYQAAMSAGAREVLDKAVVGPDLLEALGGALLDQLAELATSLEVRVGPVPSGAARAWIANTRTLVAALRAQPDVLDEPVPASSLDRFDRFLRSWSSVAEADETFLWQARADPEDVRQLLAEWAVIDRMTDAQLARLGCHWSPPEGAAFFVALTSGVVGALQAHEATRDLADELAAQWRRPQEPTSPT